jgi:aminomethyltransferase
MLEADHYMIVVNAGTQDKDWAWFSKHAQNFNVKLRNDSDAMSLLAIQGKNAIDTLAKLTDVDLKSIEYYHFVKGKLADVDMIISRTGYTGEPGFEIYFPSDPAVAIPVWDKIFEAGKVFGIEPIGLGARDTLRLEMGYCLYGNDIDDTTNPLEAGLGWITKLKKETPCHAFAVIGAKKEAGLDRKLVGFVIEEKGAIARHGYRIFDDAGYHIGDVTSGSISPTLQKSIGLGYVALKFGSIGSEIMIQIREGKRVPARIVKPPFVKSEAKAA